jgi:hypothetical protein
MEDHNLKVGREAFLMIVASQWLFRFKIVTNTLMVVDSCLEEVEKIHKQVALTTPKSELTVLPRLLTQVIPTKKTTRKQIKT